MSELLEWFKKRRETRALNTMSHHLTTTMTIIDNLIKEANLKAGMTILTSQLLEAIERERILAKTHAIKLE